MQFMNKDFAEHRVVPNDQTYEVIMRMLVRAKRLQGGIDLLEDMKDKGESEEHQKPPKLPMY